MADRTPKQVASQSVRPTAMPGKGEGFHISHILGWIAGAFSLLHLIRDLTPVELFGLVREWVDAYSLLVTRVTTFFFGWIDSDWIRVSDNEGHIVALELLVTAAAARAFAHSEWLRSEKQQIQRFPLSFWDRSLLRVVILLLPIGMAMLSVSLICLLMLLLPDPWGVVVGGFPLAFWALCVLAFPGAALPGSPTSQDIRREFLAVGAVFLVLVILNYTVFRAL